MGLGTRLAAEEEVEKGAANLLYRYNLFIVVAFEHRTKASIAKLFP